MSKRSITIAFITFFINIPLAISPILSGVVLGIGMTIIGGIALGYIIV